jgi:hypothetical protein
MPGQSKQSSTDDVHKENKQNPTEGHGGVWLLSVVCCHVDSSVTGRLLVQRSCIDCGVSECD